MFNSGSYVNAVAAALGLSQLFAYSPLAYDVVRYLGAAYLLYLAWRTFTAEDESFVMATQAPVARARLFFQGMLTSILNPKVALFYLTFLPQFVDPERGSVAAQMLILGAILNVMGLTSKIIIAFTAGQLGNWLRGRPRIRRLQRWFMASVLAGLALRIALPEKR